MKITEKLKKIWNDSVWSQVLAWAIIALITYIFTSPFPGSLSSCTKKNSQTSVTKQTSLSPDKYQKKYKNPVPRRDENDVLIPSILLQLIPGFDQNKTVYAATYKNNWLNIPNSKNDTKILEDSIMKRQGDEWRAISLAGTRFHPVQLINSNLTENKFKPGNISWLLVEDLHKVYGDNLEKFKEEFLDKKEGTFLVP